MEVMNCCLMIHNRGCQLCSKQTEPIPKPNNDRRTWYCKGFIKNKILVGHPF
jgi:hypothetical protein